MVSVSGRPRRNWECSITIVEGRLLVRLDDRDDPEFWIEMMADTVETDRLQTEWGNYWLSTLGVLEREDLEKEFPPL